MTAPRRHGGAGGVGRPFRIVSALATAVVVLLGAAACSGDDEGPTRATATSPPPATDPHTGAPAPPPDLRMGLDREPGSLDPVAGRFDRATLQLARAVFDPLLAYDERLDLQPVLAESVTPSDDLRTWTIELRPGVRFDDGQVFDASVVVRMLDRARGSQAFSRDLDLIGNVDAVDDHRVVVQMREPWSTFPHVLAGQLGMVTAQRARSVATTTTTPTSTVVAEPEPGGGPGGGEEPVPAASLPGKTDLAGTGPFRIDSWTPARSVRVVRVQEYWRGTPARAPGIVFHFVGDPTARSSMLIGGQLDIAQFDEPAAMADVEEAERRTAVVVHADKAGETPELVLALATDRAPFEDRSARLALAEAIDRDALSRRVFNAQYPPAEGPFSEGSRWYGQAQWPLRDPNAAREELGRRADPTRPLGFDLLVEDTPINRRLVEELGFQLHEIGVELVPVWVDGPELRARVSDWRFTAALVELFGGQHPDEDYATLHSRTDGSGFSNQWIDEALDEARTVSDITSQAEAFQTVQEQLARELPFVFLVRARNSIVTSPRIHDLERSELPNGRPALPQLRGTVALDRVYLE